jgi:hypothetical protein
LFQDGDAGADDGVSYVVLALGLGVDDLDVLIERGR